MKYLSFFVLMVFFSFSACKKLGGSTNESLEGLEQESIDYSIDNRNLAIPDNNKNQNNLSIFGNKEGEKAIKYISWENVVKFIDYETIALSTYNRMTGEESEYIGIYTQDVHDNMTFLNIHFNNGTDERWLILANGTLCDIFKSGNRLPGNYVHGVTGSVNRDEIIYFYPRVVRASSYLTENEISYSPDNLKIYYWSDTPWVEGVDGHGINEKIFFEQGHIPNGSMYISIGYVSYDKPYLYNQNSRPKKISLLVENKFAFEVELKDTPHYQEIKFPSDIDRDDILVLEILEVYPGTKYEDTCINSIYFEWYTDDQYYENINYWEGQPGW